MKKSFIKLLPVAVGMLVLASCSSDDFLGINGQTAEYQLGEGEILVTVDEDADVTRAAFGEAVKVSGTGDAATYALKRSVFWREGDAIKIYDKDNWRPQYFLYESTTLANDKEMTKKETAAIPAVFKFQDNDATLGYNSPKNTSSTAYTNGYAMFPAKTTTAFEGEERGTINFDLNDLRFWTWDTEAADFFASGDNLGKTWHTVFPMWGNVDNQILKLKYLTGFLRIEKSGMDESKYGYLVIESTKQLWGNFRAFDFDYEAKAAPVLVGQADAAELHAALPATDRTINFTDPDNANYQNKSTMVIALPTADLAVRNVFYIPVPADAAGYGLQIYYKEYAAAQTEIEIAAADEPLYKNATFTEIPQTGTFFKIDQLTENSVKTPYELAQKIIEYDKGGRDITFDITGTGVDMFTVTGDDTPGDYLIDLSGHALQHNITVNLKNYKTENKTHTAKLFINTAASSKTLTLNFDGAAAFDKEIIINGETPQHVNTSVAGKLVLDGAMSNIVVSNVATKDLVSVDGTVSGKITLNGGHLSINSLAATNDAMTIANITTTGTPTIQLYNGIITKIQHPNAVASKVTLNSFGKSAIGSVRNTADDADGYKTTSSATVEDDCFVATSTWDGIVYDGTDAKTGEALTSQNVIFTAAQMAIWAGAADGTLHSDLIIGANDDADAAAKAWPGVALTAGFDGFNHNLDLKITAPKAGQNETGFFKTVVVAGKTIKNLDVKANIALPRENLHVTNDTRMIGGLIANVNAANAADVLTIDNVQVNEEAATTLIGYDVTADANIGGSSIGGMIGRVNKGAVKVVNSIVKGNLVGFNNLGGFVGYIADGSATFGKDGSGDNNYSPCTTACTYAVKKAVLTNTTDKRFGTVGTFVGSGANGKIKVDVHLNSYSAAASNGATAIAAVDAANKGTLKFTYNTQIRGVDAETGLGKQWDYQGSKDNIVGYIDGDGDIAEWYWTTGTVPTYTRGAFDNVFPTAAGVQQYDLTTKPRYYNYFKEKAQE